MNNYLEDILFKDLAISFNEFLSLIRPQIYHKIVIQNISLNYLLYIKSLTQPHYPLRKNLFPTLPITLQNQLRQTQLALNH